MAKRTQVVSYGAMCACGNDMNEIRSALRAGKSGLQARKLDEKSELYPLGLVSIPEELSNKLAGYSRFEQMMIQAMEEAMEDCELNLQAKDTLCIMASTKGNIDALRAEDDDPNTEVLLSASAQKLQAYFGFAHLPLIVSNACISGVSALIWAHRHLQAGNYKHVVCVGADCVTPFVLSGFQAFMALSKEICKPFDQDRDGLNLGEASACVILSTEPLPKHAGVSLAAGAIANDANHISGPSRTGEGLFRCVQAVLPEDSDLDFISAHGTATPYNDNMESIAFNRLNLAHVPVNSFKAYVGHTLGAAGLLETIFSIESMRQQRLYCCLGLEHLGACEKLNVIRETHSAPIHQVIKTASGFGGCNAAIRLEKSEKN